MTSAEIRQQFLDFFVKRHGHTLVPSSPVVPHDDPTLLFTNAGMNQFKPYFLGVEKPPWKRIANTQKCIRAGGKHNDLDDVGRSRRHHTFFEMLGNWSFGDYFKREAIAMSWELLTKVFKLDPMRLHVTCFAGDEKLGVPRDVESARVWKEVSGLPDDHIHFFPGVPGDNFWVMGDTGPCGPCTEMHYDRTPDKSGGKLVNTENPDVMEIWNDVFIEYNRNPDGTLSPLPARHVDTGMGFERMCQILQGKSDNYGSDVWQPYFGAISDLCGKKYTGQFPPTNAPDPALEAANPQLRADIAFRVVADHVRCLTFAITDGAAPSNEGRGYVLRRILRRAVRFGRQHLDLREPFMHKLVPVVVDAMDLAFPELIKTRQSVEDLIWDEEVSFGKTLDRGIELFEMKAGWAALEAIVRGRDCSALLETDREVPLMFPELDSFEDIDFGVETKIEIWEPRAGQPHTIWRGTIAELNPELVARLTTTKPTIRANDAFKLHDTYGFPIDLTRIMAEERGMSVDIAGYDKLMEEAKERARAGGKQGQSRLFALPPDVLAKLNDGGVKPTDDSFKFDAAPIGATVRAIWDGHRLLDATHGSEAAKQGIAIILDRTNFYAEMGGQVGDTGELRSNHGAVMDVKTARAAGGYVLHVGDMLESHLAVGDHVTATLAGVRPRTEKNHTATHLANWALREVVGEGVQQKGSLVDPDKLRFDFSHGKSLSDDEIARIEKLVNEGIAKKLPVFAEEAPQEQALKINGLRAVFGEKYPPAVRVVSIGAAVADLLGDPANAKWREYSIEFCGGTHLKNTADVEAFVIVSEESVSKGIRRIVALTGVAASAAMSKAKKLEAITNIRELQQQLATESLPLTAKRQAQSRVAELQAQRKAAEKSQASSSNIDVGAVADGLLTGAQSFGAARIIVGEVPGASDEQLRSAMDSLKKRAVSHGIMLASAADEKVNFVAAVSDDVIALGLKAGDWIRETAKAAGGGGGGRPQMAQAGGKDPAKLPAALEVARQFAQRVLTK